MKRILLIFIASSFFSCKDVSNGGDETNPDSATKYVNPHGDPAGGGVYSTDSTDHKNMEPQLQGGSKGTGNNVKNDSSNSGYNNDTSRRMMNPGPADDNKKSNPDSAKKASQK